MYANLVKKLAQYIDDSPLTSVIAGGCLRDIDLRLRPKDIDIFVETENTAQIENYLTDLIQINGSVFDPTDIQLTRLPDNTPEEYREQLQQFIFQVHDFSCRYTEGERVLQTSVQVIFYNKENFYDTEEQAENSTAATFGRAILGTFDLNMSHIFCYYNHVRNRISVVKHPEYLRGVAFKSIYPVRWPNTEAQRQKTRDRLDRHSRKLRYTPLLGYDAAANEIVRGDMLVEGHRLWVQREEARQLAIQQANVRNIYQYALNHINTQPMTANQVNAWNNRWGLFG